MAPTSVFFSFVILDCLGLGVVGGAGNRSLNLDCDGWLGVFQKQQGHTFGEWIELRGSMGHPVGDT